MKSKDGVDRTLKRLAERGVLRGFGQTRGREGQTEYRFLWHGPRPHRLLHDPEQRRLVFLDLLPGIPYRSVMDRALRRFLRRRSDPALPAHRRVDEKRLVVRVRNRQGLVTLELELLDRDWDYAVRKALALLNEVFFAFLTGPYEAYMVEHFGAPEE